MNSILAVEKGLPPGLWLPTPDEPTEKYLSERFNHSGHLYEDIVDYGSFVVALALLESHNSARPNLMPTADDFSEMFVAGYGLSEHILRDSGGVARVQLALGFYPRTHKPSREDVMERFKWIAEYGYPLEYGEEGFANADFEEILAWGSARRLSPGPKKIYEIFEGDTTALRKQIGKERHNYRRQYSRLDLFRFGARVIHENGGPLTIEQLNDKYADEFVAEPYQTIRTVFGAGTDFWIEFGYAINPNLNREELLNLGTRWAIQHDGEIVTTNRIAELSKANLFPSKQPIARRFDGVSEYRSIVAERYAQYQGLENELADLGIEPEITKLAARLFEHGPIFEKWLRDNLETLAMLSNPSTESAYVRKLMKDGLDLVSEAIFAMQFEDLLSALRRLGIKSKAGIRFVLEAVPRLSADEMLSR